MKVMFCDMYNFKITGDISANLNAASCDSPTHSGPSIMILNDQGGDVMNISEDVTSTLRAQDHGHPPVVCLNFQGSKSNNVVSDDGKAYSLNAMHGHDVHVVCFEPGILKRDCSAGNRAYVDICSTLRAQMGDNQPAVCYAFQGKAGSEASLCVGKDVSHTLRPSIEADIVFAIDHVVTTGGNCTAQGPCVYENICPTEKASGVHAVCFQNTGQGWWNQDSIAQTIRTPCGGDSMKANLILTEEDADG